LSSGRHGARTSFYGLAYYDKKSHDQAIADYTKAIELDPDAISYFRRLAYYDKESYDQATLRATATGSRAKQILLDARFQQGFPRSLQGLAPLRVGESLIHGLGAAVEIAFLGRFGDPF
jgi:tetratricopeptide (TPR) repeat protein